MKKFKFRLQKIASTKEKQVKQKSGDLAKLFNERDIEKIKLQNMREELSSVQDEIFHKSIEGCAVSELVDSQKYAELLTQNIKQQKKNIEELDSQIEELKVILLNLNKEKKVLVKLKEKRYVNYLQEQNREEQKILDEMSLLSKEIRQIL
jgi:flagellar protein FliJ